MKAIFIDTQEFSRVECDQSGLDWNGDVPVEGQAITKGLTETETCCA